MKAASDRANWISSGRIRFARGYVLVEQFHLRIRSGGTISLAEVFWQKFCTAEPKLIWHLLFFFPWKPNHQKRRVYVATFLTRIHYIWILCTIYIPDGEIPYDGVVLTEQATVDISVTIIFAILASGGLVFAAFCLVFNFIFRKKKQVK